jgi:hypothetical protein
MKLGKPSLNGSTWTNLPKFKKRWTQFDLITKFYLFKIVIFTIDLYHMGFMSPTYVYTMEQL